jgi:hypothetical protein
MTCRTNDGERTLIQKLAPFEAGVQSTFHGHNFDIVRDGVLEYQVLALDSTSDVLFFCL